MSGSSFPTVFCWISVEMTKTYGERWGKIVFSQAASVELFVQDYGVRWKRVYGTETNSMITSNLSFGSFLII